MINVTEESALCSKVEAKRKKIFKSKEKCERKRMIYEC
jgi:hypothetical protein